MEYDGIFSSGVEHWCVYCVCARALQEGITPDSKHQQDVVDRRSFELLNILPFPCENIPSYSMVKYHGVLKQINLQLP